MTIVEKNPQKQFALVLEEPQINITRIMCAFKTLDTFTHKYKIMAFIINDND
jgi:hypothetical protein